VKNSGILKTSKPVRPTPADQVSLSGQAEKDAERIKKDLKALERLEEYDAFRNQYIYRPFVEQERTNRVARALLGKTKRKQVSFSEAGERIMQGRPVNFVMGRMVPGCNLLFDRGKEDLGPNCEVESPEQLHEFRQEAGENLENSAYSYFRRKMEKYEKMYPSVDPDTGEDITWH